MGRRELDKDIGSKREEQNAEESEDDEDAIVYAGRTFRPNTDGIRDGGECFWDTMTHYGVGRRELRTAARTAGLQIDQHVDARDIANLLTAINGQRARNERISIRLVTFDLIRLRAQAAVTIGQGPVRLYVGLFNHEGEGHYVPES